MDKQKAIGRVKRDYDRAVKEIEIADKIAKKIDPLLPKGWTSEIDSIVNNLIFQCGSFCSEDSHQATEFKLVCKLVEKAIGEKIVDREGQADKRDGKDNLYILQGSVYHYSNVNGDKICLGINIILYNPKHQCEIEWKKETKVVAKISDNCLGLSPAR